MGPQNGRASPEADRRRITLYRGQVFAEVAHLPGAPFVVESRRATATALGTAYVVRDEGSSTLVTVVESSVRPCASTRRTTASCSGPASAAARPRGGSERRAADP